MIPSREVTTWMSLHRLLHTSCQWLIFVKCSFFVLQWLISKKSYSLDVALTGIGYHVLMAEAMMTHYPINPFTHLLSYKMKSTVHGFIQVLSTLLVLSGEYGKLTQNEVQLSHFRKMSGFVSMCLCIVGLFGGLINFFKPRQILDIVPLRQVRIVHNLHGLIVFTVGMMTVYLDYQSDFFPKGSDQLLLIPAFLALVLAYKFDQIYFFGKRNSFLWAMSVIGVGLYRGSARETINIFVYLVAMISPLKSLEYKLNKTQ